MAHIPKSPITSSPPELAPTVLGLAVGVGDAPKENLKALGCEKLQKIQQEKMTDKTIASILVAKSKIGSIGVRLPLR
jgi:hypothetical protein